MEKNFARHSRHRGFDGGQSATQDPNRHPKSQAKKICIQGKKRAVACWSGRTHLPYERSSKMHIAFIWVSTADLISSLIE
jgi:hypothetical protein